MLYGGNDVQRTVYGRNGMVYGLYGTNSVGWMVDGGVRVSGCGMWDVECGGMECDLII